MSPSPAASRSSSSQTKTTANQKRGTPKSSTSSKPAGKRKKRTTTLASQADKFACYQGAVQAPEADVRMMTRVFKSEFKRLPTTLREDFCGTGMVACDWARRPGREAWGVDLDAPTLEWGTDHNVASLTASAQERVHFVEGDVRSANTPRVDVVAAQNYSFWIFKTRDALREYFKAAYANLNDNGVLFMDMVGGYQFYEDEREEERDYDDYTYIWDQHSFDPISADITCFIHFEFEDGSRLNRAFRYDWRLWTMPEVRELLEEAGFRRSDVYWETTDSKTGEGTGTYQRRIRGEADPAWLAYLVAVK